jgi:asparagine synthase (glutamine-hydrolysing)
MCGIFGILTSDPRGVDPGAVGRAVAALRHRGPDDEGYALFARRGGEPAVCGGPDSDPRLALPPLSSAADRGFDIALGHRRLSILDLSPAGHQPMSSPDGRYWITYNGEVYNYLELRDELAGLGHRFHTQTDTEVLLAAYSQWGVAALPRLVGMFAFGLLDRRENTLLLARDFFGIKPLFYTVLPDGFAFASEIKALLALPGLSRQVNPQSLYDFLRAGLCNHNGETMLANVKRLPPAHYVQLRLPPADGALSAAAAWCDLKPERFWRLELDQTVNLSFDQAATRLRELFLDSVRLHLRSDVPVGTCLSGGVDSSAIVMGVRAVSGNQADFHSFSYLADVPAINEQRWSDIVAAAAVTTPHAIRFRPEELVADLDAMLTAQDEPLTSASMYAQYRVFRRAKEVGVKVLLDGQGADEMLAGYSIFWCTRLGALVNGLRWRRAARLHRGIRGRGPSRHEILRGVARALPRPLAAAARALFAAERMPPWLVGGWFDQRGVTRTRLGGDGAATPLRAHLFEAFTQTSMPILLRFEDRNSMAHSIESRVPFLTPALAQFVFSLPDEYLIDDDGTSKRAFRAAMRGIVPDAILDRRDKIGFTAPDQALLTALGPWVEEALGGATARAIPAIDVPTMQADWNRVRSGQQTFDVRFWRWLYLIRWSELISAEYA